MAKNRNQENTKRSLFLINFVNFIFFGFGGQSNEGTWEYYLQGAYFFFVKIMYKNMLVNFIFKIILFVCFVCWVYFGFNKDGRRIVLLPMNTAVPNFFFFFETRYITERLLILRSLQKKLFAIFFLL